MPDENVGVMALVRLYRLRPGEWIDASRDMALRGRQLAPDVPLYPIYAPNDRRKDEGVLYDEWATRIDQCRGTDELWNPHGDTVPEQLLNGEPYSYRR